MNGCLSAVLWVLAVLTLLERGDDALLSPDFAAGPFWVRSEEGISLREVPIDCLHCLVHRLVVAIVDDRLGHTAEHGLYDVKKLGPGRERGQTDRGRPVFLAVLAGIDLLDPVQEPLRCVPASIVPGQVQLGAAAILLD